MCAWGHSLRTNKALALAVFGLPVECSSLPRSTKFRSLPVSAKFRSLPVSAKCSSLPLSAK
eukprot:251150-Chlamydomonas_euryale.AAC.2